METPAQRLLGMILPGGWKVIRPVEKRPGSSGGFFSCGYVVESETGQLGFLKALDYSAAMAEVDPARALQVITEMFNFGARFGSGLHEQTLGPGCSWSIGWCCSSRRTARSVPHIRTRRWRCTVAGRRVSPL